MLDRIIQRIKNNETNIFTFSSRNVLTFAWDTFFINIKSLLKYLEINIRSAENNTTKEFIVNLPALQKSVIFLLYH